MGFCNLGKINYCQLLNNILWVTKNNNNKQTGITVKTNVPQAVWLCE